MYDLVVVGGGISGLYSIIRFIEETSNKIFKTKPKILLLESSDKLGGRLQTYYDKDKRVQYETGGSRFHSKHVLLNRLIDRYHLERVETGIANKVTCDNQDKHHLIQKFIRRPKDELIHQTFGEYIATNYSEENRKIFQTAFGYDAEFNYLNAYDGIKMFQRDFSPKVSYSVLKHGYTSLIQSLRDEIISKNVEIHLHEDVVDIEMMDSTFKIISNKNQYISEYLFVTIPLYSLLKIPFIKSLSHNEWLDSVQPVSLHRIYGQFTKKSRMRLDRTTTHLPIRQYIPFSKETRLAMVSYSDTTSADYWNNIRKKYGIAGLKKELEDELSTLDKTCGNKGGNIKLAWVKSYYWENGVHVWKKGFDSSIMSKKALQPISNNKKFFIMGESFSKHQGWVEGALETVENGLKMI